jgi:MSHA biogenesis protein MshL
MKTSATHSRRFTPPPSLPFLGLWLLTLLITPVRAEDPLPAMAGLKDQALYSFQADNLDLKQALALFARANNLNIIPDLEVSGSVTVDFRNLPLDHAIEALVDAHGYYFQQDRDLIRVRDMTTRIYEMDYIQITRTGSRSNNVSVSSGGSSATDGSVAAVTTGSTADLWTTIGEQLGRVLSPAGSYSINGLAGTIIITDRYRNVQRALTFLDSISTNIKRQVELEVEIYEVAFTKEQQLGIDWQRVSNRLDATFGGSVIVNSPVYGSGSPAVPSLIVNHQRGGLTAVLEALQQQGDLKVVSKPRLRTLNNQPAVVRVGQDYPFFLSEISQTTTAAGINRDVSESLQTVTIGTVLSITPRVSSDGIISLDITPAITRLVGEVQSAELGNRAPIIDIRQAASIVRVRNGDTITLAGLIQTTNNKTTRKIPLLGDIPVLGKAFTGTNNVETQTELVIFVTPRVVVE